jgi:hypothetical protein
MVCVFNDNYEALQVLEENGVKILDDCDLEITLQNGNFSQNNCERKSEAA